MPRLDRLITVYICAPFTRLMRRVEAASIPILAYHSVSENLFGYSHPYYQINTAPSVFSAQMRWLKNAGYRSISLAEAWNSLAAGEKLRKTVVITFDDGYRDFYTEAMDILRQCGFTATVFLTTGRIRQTAMRIEGADYLTWSEVRELQSEGIQFGSHTVTHPDLRSLDPDLLDYELGQSKEVIEQNLSTAVDSFSYPFSFPEEDRDFTRFLEDLLKNLGFSYGVSTILGRADRRNNCYFLPRLPVNSWDDAKLLQAKVEGGYDWLHWPQLMKKSLFHNSTLMQQGLRKTKQVF